MNEIGEVARAREWVRTGRAQRIRRAADVSLSEIANHLGVSKATVHRWESGHCAPRANVAVRYVHLLDQLRRRSRRAA